MGIHLKHSRVFHFLLSGLFIFIALGIAYSAPIIADSSKNHLSEDEREHYRAKHMREQAVRESEFRSGYPHVYEDETLRIQQDFMALSQQMARLSALLQNMATSQSSMPGFMPVPPYAPLGNITGPVHSRPDQHPRSDIYGPEGPTIDTVRLILEYRLMVMGNPRLNVGEIKDHKDTISVQVVTIDGSTVEEYSVDKKTGDWHLKP